MFFFPREEYSSPYRKIGLPYFPLRKVGKSILQRIFFEGYSSPFSKKGKIILLPQERIFFPSREERSYLLPLRINGEGYSSPISTIGKIFLPLENILEGSSSLLPHRRNRREYSPLFPPKRRFFFPREEYSSPSGSVFLFHLKRS